MTVLFLKVLNMSVSASWLILAVLALRFVLKRAPKWINMLLWGMVAVRLTCPFSVPSAASLIPSTEAIRSQLVTLMSQGFSVNAHENDHAVDPASGENQASDEFRGSGAVLAMSGSSEGSDTLAMGGSTGSSAAPAIGGYPEGSAALADGGSLAGDDPLLYGTKEESVSAPQDIPHLQVWMPVLEGIWVLGMVILLGYVAVSYWRLCKKVDTAVMLRDNVFQSEKVRSPFVLGMIRPKIYLPFQMDGKYLELVMAHEKAHVR